MLVTSVLTAYVQILQRQIAILTVFKIKLFSEILKRYFKWNVHSPWNSVVAPRFSHFKFILLLAEACMFVIFWHVVVDMSAVGAPCCKTLLLMGTRCFDWLSMSLSVLQIRTSSRKRNSSPGAKCLLHMEQRKQSTWNIRELARMTRSVLLNSSLHFTHRLLNSLYELKPKLSHTWLFPHNSLELRATPLSTANLDFCLVWLDPSNSLDLAIKSNYLK